MQKEKEEGKHRGGLFQAEVVSLQGLSTLLCHTVRDQTVAGYFLMCNKLETSRHYTVKKTNSLTCGLTKPNPHAVIFQNNANADKQLHAHAFAGGDLVSGNEIEFLCYNY